MHAITLRLAALCLAGLGSASALALAEPVVAPLMDENGGVHQHHSLGKYQLFNAPTGVTHAGGVMRWHYRDANRPASISKASAISQIQSAMAKWSAVCRITFAYQGETTTNFSLPSSQFDGLNVVGWDATGLSAPTTGITSVAWNGSGNFIDAEIRFNAAYAVTVSSFDATATHEVGHALGLDHSDVSGQVMSGPPLTSYNGSSNPSADDIAGCVRLYGAAGGGGPLPLPPSSSQSYQDMWWSPGENGWGLTITQHGEKLFLAWYVYDAGGNPTWVVMSAGQWNASRTTFSGEVHIPSGAWFGNYEGGRFNAGAAVGNASVTFATASTGLLTYNVNGVAGTKPIARLPFGPVNNAPIASYGDMWWAGSGENGWGLVVSQQYHNLFATWFTYDAAGRPTWFVMSDGVWSSPTTYTGALYRARGAPVIGATYNPGFFNLTQVGTLTLTFTGANTGTMTYTVDGLTQTKGIGRFDF